MIEASNSDLLRSSQRDGVFLQSFNRQLLDAVGTVFGQRLVYPWINEINVFGAALYLSLSILSRKQQTVGQEFCDIRPILSNGRQPSVMSAGPYVLAEFGVKYLNRKFNIPLQKTDLDLIHSLHIALFYLKGHYLNLAHRLLGIRYLLLRQRQPDSRGRLLIGYEWLGVLLLVRLLLQIKARTRTAIQTFKESREELSNGNSDAQLVNPNEKRLLCTLCLCGLQQPSCTPCGHVFCWQCVISWCQETGGKCPICRERINIAHIIQIRTFAVV